MKRKILVTLILFLFLLPFVSWYYLRSGLSWRKEAQSQMTGTAPLPAGAWVDVRGKQWDAQLAEDHVNLIGFIPCAADTAWTALVTRLYDHFRETGRANILLLDSCLTSPGLPDTTWKKTYQIDCAASGGLCAGLLTDWPRGANFALADRKQVVRAYYPAGTREEKRTLLEHMALLLPRERSDKVELRRGVNQ